MLRAAPDGNLAAFQNPINLSIFVHDVAGFSALGDAPQSAAAFSLGGVKNDESSAQSFGQRFSSRALDVRDREGFLQVLGSKIPKALRAPAKACAKKTRLSIFHDFSQSPCISG